MINEIYCRLNSDLNYEDKVETDSEKEQILQQVRVILGTKPGNVLGNCSFGIDLEKYLFMYTYSQDEILMIVNLALAAHLRYDTTKWKVYAEISYGHNANDVSDYAVIDIVINQQKCLGILVNQS